MAKTIKPEIVFECRKCEHNLFVAKDQLQEKILKVIKMDCPNCGEEAGDIWILSREGDYNKEYGKK